VSQPSLGFSRYAFACGTMALIAVLCFCLFGIAAFLIYKGL
jgi:hypothetical protein